MNMESRTRSARRIAVLALATAAAGVMLLPAAQANASTGQVAGAHVLLHEKPVLCKHRHKCGDRHHRCHRCGHHHHHCHKCGHHHGCGCHGHHHDSWHDHKYKDDHDHDDKYKDDHHDKRKDDHDRHDSRDKKKRDHHPHFYGHHDHGKWWEWPHEGNGAPWWRADENNRGRA